MAEKATSSTERELLAVIYFLQGLGHKFVGQKITIHTDSNNVAIICDKGSKKPKLQAYAKLIIDLTILFKIELSVKWIPRDINMVADFISQELDYTDYEIVPEMFSSVCNAFQLIPETDCFANNSNAKCPYFYSATYSPGCVGVDAYSYDWAVNGLCWIFTAPDQIIRALLHAEQCKANVLLLVPQWRNSSFYPVLNEYRRKAAFRKCLVFNGSNAFKSNTDISSYFGPNYVGHFEVYHFNF
jgi:RNase H-like domain found in reverse transcriptase